MPGLLCYRQTVLSTSAGPFAGLSNKLVQFDALSEYHYVSKQAWLDAQETEAGVQLQADSESFMCVRSPRSRACRQFLISPSSVAGTWAGCSATRQCGRGFCS